MANQQVANTFLIGIDGTPLPAEITPLLVYAHVDDSRSLPDVAVLRFRDPNRMVLAKAGAKIGSKITVSIARTDGQTPEKLLDGEITALEAEFDSTGTFTLIRAYDISHRLFRGRTTQTYTQVTASDVATTVAGRAGLPTGKIDATNTVFDHVSQAAVSDWDFLTNLGREIGHEVTVQEGKLDFCVPEQASTAPAAGSGPGTSPLVLTQGVDLLRFRAVVSSSEQVKQVQVRGWDVTQKKAVVATAPGTTTSAQLPDVDPAKLAHTFGDPTFVSTDVPYRLQAEADAAARALADQIAGTFAEFDGVARGNPKIRAGAAISIAAVGSPFDGKYVVTRSRHVFDQHAGYTTQFAVTGRSERSLYGLTSGGATGLRRIPGVVVAQVSDVADPQQQARVKLTFPWLSDSYVSDWARTAHFGAGKNRGSLFLPEVGDEVLVAFEQGDIRRPYVVGSLYNGVDTPPPGDSPLVDSGSGAVDRRSFVSRLGHRIDFQDADSSPQGVTIRTGDKKLSFSLDASKTDITVHSDGTVTITSKKGVTVDAGSSTVEIKGGDLKLSGTNGVTIDGGGGAVKVTAGSELALSGATAKLEGSGQAEVKGGGSLALSGGVVRIN